MIMAAAAAAAAAAAVAVVDFSPLPHPCQARVVELKNKCEAIERREAERRAVEERKRKEEIDFLKCRGKFRTFCLEPKHLDPKSWSKTILSPF